MTYIIASFNQLQFRILNLFKIKSNHQVTFKHSAQKASKRAVKGGELRATELSPDLPSTRTSIILTSLCPLT